VAGVVAVPSIVGSEKFGTPCERMHAANLSPAERTLGLAVVVDLLDDPQAAITSAKHVTASAITPPWRVWCGVLVVGVRRVPSG
jgi:hypothetical protein